MAEKKILFMVEAMSAGVFTYIVDLTNDLQTFKEMSIGQKTAALYNDIVKGYDKIIMTREFVQICGERKQGKITFDVFPIYFGWFDNSAARKAVVA